MIAGVEALSQAVELPKLVKLPDIFLYTESMTPPPPTSPQKRKSQQMHIGEPLLCVQQLGPRVTPGVRPTQT